MKELKALRDKNARLKKLLAERDLEVEVMKEIAGKCMVRPLPASLNSCDLKQFAINVSGLLQVDRCYGQAMMRFAHLIPVKWKRIISTGPTAAKTI